MVFEGKGVMKSWRTMSVGMMPEYSWWQILLINLVWMAFFLLIQWLLSFI